jgi:hypothetical protein
VKREKKRERKREKKGERERERDGHERSFPLFLNKTLRQKKNNGKTRPKY